MVTLNETDHNAVAGVSAVTRALRSAGDPAGVIPGLCHENAS